MWHHKLRKGGSLTKTLASIGDGAGSGISALSQDLTINSQTVSPTFRYEAKDATLSGWTATVGANLTAAGSGGSVDLDTPLANDTDKAVDCAGTRYWNSGDSTLYTMGTDDVVFEFVAQVGTVFQYFLGATNLGGSSVGYAVYNSSAAADRMTITIRVDDLSVASAFTENLTNGHWAHFMLFIDRSGSMQWYVNGAASGSPVSVTGIAAAQSTNWGPWILGGANTGSHWQDEIAYAAMWQSGSWLDTHLQEDVASTRAAKLTGTYDSKLSVGPTQSLLRNSNAILEKQNTAGIQQWFSVAPRWMRIETRPDRHNRYNAGVHMEQQHTNLLTYSDALDNAAWTKVRSSVSPNVGEATDGQTTADWLIEDSTASATHYAEQTFTQSAAAHTLQCVVEPAGLAWVQLEMESATDGVASAYIDCASGVIGTELSNDTARARYLGGGRYLVSLTDTRATAESCTARVYLAESDGGRVYTGTSSKGVYLSAMQVVAEAVPVSHIPTEAATVTRLGDSLAYEFISLPSTGALAISRLGHQDADFRGLGALSDGTANDRVLMFHGATYVEGLIANGGVTQAQMNSNPETPGDYVWEEWRTRFGSNDCALLRDGSELVTDTSATMPTLTKLNVGTYQNNATAANALVRVRVSNTNSDKSLATFGVIMSIASGYISTPAGVSVSTSYVNVGGTFTSVNLSDFTLSAAGVFAYTGTDTKRFHVIASVSGAKSGGGTAEVTTAVEKNGAAITASEVTRDVSGSAIGAWAVVCDVELATNDTINFATKLGSGTETITIDTLSCVIEEIS